MIALGYGAIFAMGIVLGLLGGGGSILTLPILVYLFGMGAQEAIPASLFLVGVTALAGAIPFWRRGEVDRHALMAFGTPSVASIFAVRRWVSPAIPERLGPLSRDQAILVLFGIVMLWVAVAMLRPRREVMPDAAVHPVRLAFQGVAVGALAGLIGAGGGFLIVPALAKFARLPMRIAIGTSLGVIALNSGVGFAASKAPTVETWKLLGVLAAVALSGAVTGAAGGKKISGERLKKAFGVLVLAMGVFVVLSQAF